MRTEAAAGGVGGGGVVAGWDLSAEAGPGPGLGGGRSSDPGSVRRQRREKERQGQRAAVPGGAEGTPRLAERLGGVGGSGESAPYPTLARQYPASPHGRERRGGRGTRFCRLLITQKAESTGLG